MSRKIIDRTGQVFGNLKITEELGKSKVKAQCLLCGSVREYDKRWVVKGTNKSCGCVKGIKDKTGQTFNYLTIVQELGGGRIKCRCLKCGSLKEYNKSAVMLGNTKSCGCKAEVLNKTFNSLKVIEDLGYNKVKCKCLKCGSIKTFYKSRLLHGTYKDCGCSTKIEGTMHGNLKVVRRIDRFKLECKCIDCGIQSVYNRYIVMSDRNGRFRCTNCNLLNNYKNKVLGNVRILKLAYTGRNKKRYFDCIDLATNEKLILNREEILSYNK